MTYSLQLTYFYDLEPVFVPMLVGLGISVAKKRAIKPKSRTYS